MASISTQCSYSTNFSELVNCIGYLDIRNTVIFVVRCSVFCNSLALHQSYNRKCVCVLFFNVSGTRSDLSVTFSVGVERY